MYATTHFLQSASTLQWFMLAMLQHPDVQERAQAEINTVVGADRLPNFDDRQNLPYIEAILMETLRMYAVAPLGEYFDHDVYISSQVPLRTSPRYHGRRHL